jgi:Putative peptidoglycan binding domain
MLPSSDEVGYGPTDVGMADMKLMLRTLLLVVVLLGGAFVGPVPAGAQTAPAEAPGVQALPLCTTRKFVTDPYRIMPAASNGSTYCLIGNGLVGCGGTNCMSIRTLQVSLNWCYGAGIREDGFWGPETRSALIAVQRNEGADPDGIYGTETRNKMEHTPYCYELT